MNRPTIRSLSIAALAAAIAAVLSACERPRSLNPFSSSSPNVRQCRAALDYLVAREAEKTKISVEDDSERPRDALTAVTIVYVQGESRRLFTCIYGADAPGRITAGSYRGQPLTPAQLQEINAIRS
jgi:hypothetical protein